MKDAQTGEKGEKACVEGTKASVKDVQIGAKDQKACA